MEEKLPSILTKNKISGLNGTQDVSLARDIMQLGQNSLMGFYQKMPQSPSHSLKHWVAANLFRICRHLVKLWFDCLGQVGQKQTQTLLFQAWLLCYCLEVYPLCKFNRLENYPQFSIVHITLVSFLATWILCGIFIKLNHTNGPRDP